MSTDFSFSGSIKEIFADLDANNNESVEIDELIAALDALGLPLQQLEAEAIMKFADDDGDGRISEKEFTRFVNWRPKAPRLLVTCAACRFMKARDGLGVCDSCGRGRHDGGDGKASNRRLSVVASAEAVKNEESSNPLYQGITQLRAESVFNQLDVDGR